VEVSERSGGGVEEDEKIHEPKLTLFIIPLNSYSCLHPFFTRRRGG